MSTLTDFHTLEAEVFIETGTGQCETLKHAAQQYPTCHSIEQDVSLYREAVRRFRQLKHVSIHHGLSQNVLPAIIDPMRSTTFWLDAHQCGREGWPGVTTKPADGPECPLIEELQIIAVIDWKTPPIVCIDDAFLFLDEAWTDGRHENLHQDRWPTLAEVKAALPTHDFTARDRDVLIGRVRPAAMRPAPGLLRPAPSARSAPDPSTDE